MFHVASTIRRSRQERGKPAEGYFKIHAGLAQRIQISLAGGEERGERRERERGGQPTTGMGCVRTFSSPNFLHLVPREVVSFVSPRLAMCSMVRVCGAAVCGITGCSIAPLSPLSAGR